MDVCVLPIFTHRPRAAAHVQVPPPPRFIPVVVSTALENTSSLTGSRPGQALQGEPGPVMVITVV